MTIKFDSALEVSGLPGLKPASQKNTKQIFKLRGFTLLEVMIALAIAGIVTAGMYNIQSSQVNQLRNLENKTLAHWVAMNKLVEFQYFEAIPAQGEKYSDAKMAGLDWQIVSTITKTDFDQVKQVEIAVGLKPEKFDSLENFSSLARITSLIGEPLLKQ